MPLILVASLDRTKILLLLWQARAGMTKHAQAGMDFVIIGRKNTLKRPFSDLMSDMIIALKKLKTYREGI